jgi:hypothetical protein
MTYKTSLHLQTTMPLKAKSHSHDKRYEKVTNEKELPNFLKDLKFN